MTLYKCTECGELKPESEFRLRSKYKNAIDSRCRECTNMAKRNKEQRKDTLKTYISYNITTNVYKAYLDIPIEDKYKYKSHLSFSRQINKILPQDKKYCSKCDRILSTSEFTISYKGSKNCHSICKLCMIDYKRENHVREWCRQTLSSHKRRGYIVNLTIDALYDIVKNKPHCYICGQQLQWKNGNGYNTNCPSLDRVNNESSISDNNIIILCHECNRTKGAKPFDEFIEYCGYVYTKFRACKDSWRDIDGDCK